jgi:hypothetical protein
MAHFIGHERQPSPETKGERRGRAARANQAATLVETLTSPGAGFVWTRHGVSRIRHRSEV